MTTLYHLAMMSTLVMSNMTKADFISDYFGTNRNIYSAYTELSNYAHLIVIVTNQGSIAFLTVGLFSSVLKAAASQCGHAQRKASKIAL